MNLFSATGLCKSYGDKTLLDHVSFGIEEGERIGLIGQNGTGKSTLLRLVTALDKPDAGTLATMRDAVVRYLPQDPTFSPDLTVLEALACAAPIFEVQAIATRLGLTDHSARIGTLSGGQQKRVALARVLSEPSDLLVLDEPTNHIDQETVLWLEDFLQKRRGALLMVTHDRYFLERVVNRIFELDRGQVYRYLGNYEVFLEGKALREESEAASEQKRQNFLRSELAWIQRGPRARGTKQKARTQRYFDTVDQGTQSASAPMELWTANSRLGQTVIELEHIEKGYGYPLIRDFTFRVGRSDRIGIVGPSGCGKSTLLQMMAGTVTSDKGSIVRGATVKVGYYSQEQAPINKHLRVIEYAREQAHYVQSEDGQTITATQMLERFGFPSGGQWTPVGNLSGGERRRLSLLKILLGAPNVLMLDEPTNDLDLATLSVLENYLEDFSGAVIVVSHDRYFVDRVCDTVLAFEGDGRIATHLGRFSDYLASHVTIAPQPADQETAKNSDAAVDPPDRTPSRRPLRFTYQEQRDYESIDSVIAEVEQELRAITDNLAHAGHDYALTQTLYAKQQAQEKRLEELLERWTYLQERAEEIARGQKT